MSHCPSCGRYVEPCEACPYCGARLVGRVSIRTLKIVALVLAIVGLATLWFVATHTDVPLIQIGQANAMTNLAYVRLRGRCTQTPSYDPESGRLSFWLADDTGEIYVSAYRAEAQQIMDTGCVPALGDQLELAGTLRVREDFVALTVNLPEHLRISRAEPVDRAIGSITSADQYRRVRVRGQVRRTHEPYPGLTLITVRDATGEVPVAVSQDLVALRDASPAHRFSEDSNPVKTAPGTAGALSPAVEAPGERGAIPSAGQPVEIVAAVSLYHGTPQLVPATLADVVPLSQPVLLASERPIGQLSTRHAGELVAVRGTVTEVDPFSAGVKLRLNDTTGAIVILLWQSVYDLLPDPTALDVGVRVQAQGEVSCYRGELELIPELATDVQVLATATPPPAPTPLATVAPTSTGSPRPTTTSLSGSPPEATETPTLALVPTPQESATPTVEPSPLAAINDETVGQEVTVEGVVVDTSSFSAGFKFTLDDSTGEVVLLMWHEVYDDCWDALEINVGARVRATGQVAQYEGALQIQPDFGGDVKVIESAGAQAPQREIGSLGTGDAGQRVAIEGQVVRVEGLQSAAKVFVSDGSGEIAVFIWHSVLDRVPGNVGLGTPGSRVRVIGQVEVYRGNLEIVPTLPNDVVVLETP